MTLRFSENLANARANAITSTRDAATTGAKIRLYDGTPPAAGGTPTNLLGEVIFSVISAAAAANGVLTPNAITGANAIANGIATWFREVDGDNVFILDGTIGVTGSGADMILNDVNIVASQPINITTHSLTEGNFI